jgi:hypothetical protein
MTQKAKRFLEANAESPVVYGSVLGGDKGQDHVKGVFYRLANGLTFTLTCADAKTLPGTPRWAL